MAGLADICVHLVALMVFSQVTGDNILIHPMYGDGSRYIVAKVIALELVSRGHNITMLVPDRYADKLEAARDSQPFHLVFYKSNLTMVEINDFFATMTNAGLRGKYIEWIMSISDSHLQRTTSECNNLLGDTELIEQLRNMNFKLRIVDYNEQCPIVQFLGGPYVVYSPMLTIGSAVLLDNRVPNNPSYMPGFASGFDHRMSFIERLKNVGYSILFVGLLSIFSGPMDEIKTRYALTDVSLFYDEADLHLLNSHFAIDFPRPILPNTVMVGGLTTREAQPLSQDWEHFLNGAGNDGVVLFSMGTYAKGIDEDVAAMFAEAFAQIPQKVIWKLNGKPSATLSPNVKVVDWMPQNDLLGHPQIKAFVYHCGLNGIWEAVYHGVPMVAVPLFGDQYDNAQRIVSRGMGVKLNIATLTSDELANAIRTVISDQRYKANASRLSAIFRDTPRKPVELAADSVEFVLRHGGAKHLRSAALDLNIVQYLLLDVILTLLVACIVVYFLVFMCCKLCFRGCRRICGRSLKLKSA